MEPKQDVTRLLHRVSEADRAALDQLLAVVYEELRRLAQAQLWHERAGHTLTPTALVHEAYLKLVRQEEVHWEHRRHFFAAAARSMRQILVDYARRRAALRRGSGRGRVTLDEDVLVVPGRAEELLALDEAVTRLSALNERLGQVVVCRFFGGLSFEETAETLEVSLSTVKRDWEKARAWLYRELHEGTPEPG